jgi:prepilin-type N-terminal cleavage/methylation domain-containing protein
MTDNNSGRRSIDGFTVVELVVAIVIAGIIIPAVALALTTLATTNYQARDLAQANMIGQNKVESLRSIGYNSVPLSTVSFNSELPASMGKPKSASYTVSSPATGIKQVDVTISFTEYKSSKSVTYRSYISELGVGQ